MVILTREGGIRREREPSSALDGAESDAQR
jgi:hypothetical protein